MRQSTQRGEIGQKRREKLVMGNKTDDRLQSGSGRVTIIVQYVRKQYENDDIKKYLNDENVNVDNIETVSHPESLTKSFKVDIKYHDKSKVVSEDFWPQGIGCRLWRSKRFQNTEGQLAPSGAVGIQDQVNS